MGYVYGWGASVVMLGALFKLQHWNHSGLFLTIGLITEAFIFFLSAFEPPLEMPEWSKVYPELREDYEIMDMDEISPRNKKGIDELFSSSELTPELLDKVGKGLNELSNTARGISDISAATLATDLYVKNIGSASESMGTFAEINNKANETINRSVGNLAESYINTAKQLSESGKSAISTMQQTGEQFSSQLAEAGKNLANSFEMASSSITSGLNTIGEGSKQYSGNLQKLNQNINELNKNFEAQLTDTKSQMVASQKFNNDLTQMNEILASSVDELKKYKDNAEQLNKNLEALNTIYGNMLGAMSYKK
ncbi:type IX secretion system motor protein PorL/GldL [Maribellus maritimus]|uniref:type IX secretion system motor protein PorL/GldL n=1 Tax=Maribellus maritimus TaxID=2870838 RepID=UPI001EEB1169|nr:gliding motility protein GldL [Maribellus maritimus]MCG6189611.1 gliding motility protein GldL [Maribellus maritimus]